jgi:hypothetical protein
MEVTLGDAEVVALAIVARWRVGRCLIRRLVGAADGVWSMEVLRLQVANFVSGLPLAARMASSRSAVSSMGSSTSPAGAT